MLENVSVAAVAQDARGRLLENHRLGDRSALKTKSMALA